jgi:hypothetical protein
MDEVLQTRKAIARAMAFHTFYDGQSLASLKMPIVRLGGGGTCSPRPGKNLVGFLLSAAGTYLARLFSCYREPLRRWLPTV